MAHKKTGTPRKKKAAKRKKKRAFSRDAGSFPHTPRMGWEGEQTATVDPRSLERLHSDILRLMDEQEFETIDEANAFLSQFIGGKGKDIPKPNRELTPLEQAQDKMYEAWGAEDDERVKLAREALAISPDCADAYVLLAEETPGTIEETRELYQKGVEAGERALGHEFFEQNAGDFWGIIETRPYMRARAGLAETAEAMGEPNQAVEHYRELLRLNPNDNQGVRFALACRLLKSRAYEELGKLLDQYKDDATASWLYTRALWLFRKEGATKQANAELVKALKQNPFVPLYMLGAAQAPDEPPDFIEMGGEGEAIEYIGMNGLAWLDTEGAIQWFFETLIEAKDMLPAAKMMRKIMGGQ
jgi:tetratricopeptide (TPR) repeat protein